MRNPWWIAPLMLALATLACQPGPTPYLVWRIEADQGQPGRAYILVAQSYGLGGEYLMSPVAYETSNYGASWRRSEYTFQEKPETKETDNSYSLMMKGDDLYPENRGRIWSMPRPVFRHIFDQKLSQILGWGRIVLPRGLAVNKVQGDTIYVAMGTEGVLVGPAPDRPGTRAWTLSASGIDVLHPVSLAISDTWPVLLVICIAMLVLPLIWVHGYLLSRVWVYVLPLKRARRYAGMTSAGIAVLWAGATSIWLTDVRSNFYVIVAAMAGIATVGGLGVALGIAWKHSLGTHIRLAVVTVLVSLVVPAGVAGIQVTWPPILAALIGYSVYRGYLERRIIRPNGIGEAKHASRIDRLALESGMFGDALPVLPLTIWQLLPADVSGGLTCMLPWAFLGALAVSNVWTSRRMAHWLAALPAGVDGGSEGAKKIADEISRVTFKGYKWAFGAIVALLVGHIIVADWLSSLVH